MSFGGSWQTGGGSSINITLPGASPQYPPQVSVSVSGGYSQPGYPQPGYPAQQGYQAGYPTPGYPTPGYPTPGYPTPGYPTPGYPSPSYGQPSFTQPSFPPSFGGNWKICTENQYLVFRDSATPGDHRVALAPSCGSHKSLGPANHPDSHSSTLVDLGGWKITEENSALCFRDTRSGGDHRFAIYPACGNSKNYGSPHNPGRHGSHVYYRGRRWVIQEESNGVLVFRDTLTPGDHRVAFYPNCGNSVWL